jgi:trehalose 6-phosphate phosphatase
MAILSILEQRQELTARIDRACRLLLFLDFDGTLAPIVRQPALAVLPAPTRDVLYLLAELPSITISIVSGRSLADLKSRVGIPGLIYAGNHGLEIEGPGLAFEHPAATALAGTVCDITDRMSARAGALAGIEIERKGLTTSVHYRRASRAAQTMVAGLLRELIPRDDPRIEIREGKMVHEIRPRVRWDKGRAVAWIRDRLEEETALPIVIGDDMTDESAFAAFEDAITICVDPQRPTAARYQVESPDGVRAFLAGIAEVRARRDAEVMPAHAIRFSSLNQ